MHRAANHHRRTVARAIFPTRNAHANEMQTSAIQRGRAAARFVKVSVATINDSVAFTQQRFDDLDHHIHRFARRDHKQNSARCFDGLDKIRKARVASQFRPQIASFLNETIDPVWFTIGDRNIKPLVRKVQRKCTAHRPKSVNADVCPCGTFCHASSFLNYFCQITFCLWGHKRRGYALTMS